MNYIKQLQEKIKALEGQVEIYTEGLRSLENYMSLPKFHRPDNYINTADIFLRTCQIKQEINNIH